MPIREIRYAYLHYLLDPLALKYDEQLEKKRGVAQYAESAPALDEAYKSDYLLLTTTCLVKAIESRLARGEENRAAMVAEDLRQGYVFTPAFAEGLVAYEKQPQAMRLYFPELVNGIDLKREEARLEHAEFARERGGRKMKTLAPPAEPELAGGEDAGYGRGFVPARAAWTRRKEIVSAGTAADHAEARCTPRRITVWRALPRCRKTRRWPKSYFIRRWNFRPIRRRRVGAYVYLGSWPTAARREGRGG